MAAPEKKQEHESLKFSRFKELDHEGLRDWLLKLPFCKAKARETIKKAFDDEENPITGRYFGRCKNLNELEAVFEKHHASLGLTSVQAFYVRDYISFDDEGEVEGSSPSSISQSTSAITGAGATPSNDPLLSFIRTLQTQLEALIARESSVDTGLSSVEKPPQSLPLPPPSSKSSAQVSLPIGKSTSQPAPGKSPQSVGDRELQRLGIVWIINGALITANTLDLNVLEGRRKMLIVDILKAASEPALPDYAAVAKFAEQLLSPQALLYLNSEVKQHMRRGTSTEKQKVWAFLRMLEACSTIRLLKELGSDVISELTWEVWVYGTLVDSCFRGSRYILLRNKAVFQATSDKPDSSAVLLDEVGKLIKVDEKTFLCFWYAEEKKSGNDDSDRNKLALEMGHSIKAQKEFFAQFVNEKGELPAPPSSFPVCTCFGLLLLADVYEVYAMTQAPSASVPGENSLYVCQVAEGSLSNAKELLAFYSVIQHLRELGERFAHYVDYLYEYRRSGRQTLPNAQS